MEDLKTYIGYCKWTCSWAVENGPLSSELYEVSERSSHTINVWKNMNWTVYESTDCPGDPVGASDVLEEDSTMAEGAGLVMVWTSYSTFDAR